jgi:hypothetical protein
MRSRSVERDRQRFRSDGRVRHYVFRVPLLVGLFGHVESVQTLVVSHVSSRIYLLVLAWAHAQRFVRVYSDDLKRHMLYRSLGNCRNKGVPLLQLYAAVS